MKVFPERFHLNGHTAGFRPQTQKLHCSPPTLQDSAMAIKGLRERIEETYAPSRSLELKLTRFAQRFKRVSNPWFCITVIFSLRFSMRNK